MEYVRARVDPIELHLDPTLLILEREKVAVISYGVIATDLLRLKNHLPTINHLGLILLKRLNDRYGFLLFDKMLTCMHTGFKSAISEINLSCGYDVDLNDLAKLGDLALLSTWVTLRKETRNLARSIGHDLYRNLISAKVSAILGPNAEEVLGDLIWSTDSFKHHHALTFVARGDIRGGLGTSSLEKMLERYATLYQVREDRWLLLRKKENITIMDVACHIFSPNHYFEVKEVDMASELGMPVDKLSSHLRGYLIMNDADVRRIQNVRIENTREVKDNDNNDMF